MTQTSPAKLSILDGLPVNWRGFEAQDTGHVEALGHNVTAVWNQLAFRWRKDDGDETTATWWAANNVNPASGDIALDTNFRIRFEIEETATASPAGGLTPRLEYNRNGAGWSAVSNASSVVRTSGSPHVADGVATTNLITVSSRTFQAGLFDDVDGSMSAISELSNEHTEVEWCVQFRSADIVGGDTIQLRVSDSGTPLNTYTQTPSYEIQLSDPGGSFPLTDTFTDTDGVLLQSHFPDSSVSSDSIWQPLGFVDVGATTQNAEINTNRARSASLTAYSRTYRNTAVPATAEYDVEADFVVGSDGSYICGRLSPTGTTNATVDRYETFYDRATGNFIQRVVGGVGTVLDSVTLSTGSGVHAIKLELRDAAKKVYEDASEILTTTDNTVSQVGRAGLAFAPHATNANYIDNFSATNFSSGFTATGADTLPNLTAAGTAVHEQIASGTPALQNLVAAGSASVPLNATATGTPALQNLVAAGSAIHEQIASGTGALPSLLGSGVSIHKQIASGSPALRKLGAAGVGEQTQAASGAPVLQNLVAAASGYMKPAGVGVVSLPNLVGSGAATQRQSASGVSTLPGLNASGTALHRLLASASDLLPSLSAAGVAEQTQSASGAPALPSLTGSGAALVRFIVTGAPALPNLIASGVAVMHPDAAGAATLPNLVASGSATVSAGAFTASGASTLPSLIASGSALQKYLGTGTPALANLGANGSALHKITSAGTSTLPGLSASGSALHEILGSGSDVLPSMLAAGTALIEFLITGASTLPSMVASGTGVMQPDATGSPTLPSLLADGTAIQKYLSVGVGTLPNLTASGAALQEQAASGAPSLPNLVSSGVAISHYSAQSAFRFRNDDGSETTATWLAGENVNIGQDKLIPTRLRIQVDYGGNPPTKQLKLRYRKVGDPTWIDMST